MVFAYYKQLSRPQQAIYRRSDQISGIRLPHSRALQPLVTRIKAALKAQDRLKTEAACQDLIDGLTDALNIPPVRVRVRAVRPINDWGELHGFYIPIEGQRRIARIAVWMRTAQRRQIVAFRTFLRTLLHELCHHIDYTMLRLPDSFHTEGFYKRETSLFYQLVPRAQRARSAGRNGAAVKVAIRASAKRLRPRGK